MKTVAAASISREISVVVSNSGQRQTSWLAVTLCTQQDSHLGGKERMMQCFLSCESLHRVDFEQPVNEIQRFWGCKRVLGQLGCR